MIYITIKRYPFKGFYVVNSKKKYSDYCGWNPLTTISCFIWYLGVNPKYAFWLDLKLKKLLSGKVN